MFIEFKLLLVITSSHHPLITSIRE